MKCIRVITGIYLKLIHKLEEAKKQLIRYNDSPKFIEMDKSNGFR